MWKFKTDYQFYKYDKVFGAVIGKFSSRKVLYLAYEKIDQNVWRQEQEKIRLAEVAEKDRLNCIKEMMRQKMLENRRKGVRDKTNSRYAVTELK